eukprot:gene15767-4758_t
MSPLCPLYVPFMSPLCPLPVDTNNPIDFIPSSKYKNRYIFICFKVAETAFSYLLNPGNPLIVVEPPTIPEPDFI